MNIHCESPAIGDYLVETEEVDYSHPLIAELASRLLIKSRDQEDYIRRSYEYVRDETAHSWDIRSSRVTRKASEVLFHREGICYAKANLLCAILRRAGIPTGFCYQRLTLGDTPDSGYCIHALNAVYLEGRSKWVRLDARGNKPGIEAEFAIEEERLAFPIRPEYEEVDYPVIYASPNPKTMEALRQHTDCSVMYLRGLPDKL